MLLNKDTIVQDALDLGFSHAGLARIDTLRARTDVRDMCAANKCRSYNKNWSCPPGCGTVEECQAEMQSYDWGVIVQVTMDMEDAYDMETWGIAAKRHRELILEMYRLLKQRYPAVLGLGGAGCKICETCTYPDAPCRFPEERMSGMEGYGLMVNDVCKDNGLQYYYGKDTITYSGLFLMRD